MATVWTGELKISLADKESAHLYDVILQPSIETERFAKLWTALMKVPEYKSLIKQEGRYKDVLFISEVCERFRAKGGAFLNTIKDLAARGKLNDPQYVEKLHNPQTPEEIADRQYESERIFKESIVEAEESFTKQDLNKRDSLTGLWNTLQYNRYVEWMQKVGKEIGYNGAHVFMIDVDHFKHINDTYGHPVGDSVLRYMAELQKHVRTTDTVFRIGGEEFMIILPTVRGKLSPEQESHLIDRILRDIAIKFNIPLDNGSTLHKSFTAGMTYVDFNNKPNFAEAKKRVDDLMYVGKREPDNRGRNAVYIDDGAGGYRAEKLRPNFDTQELTPQPVVHPPTDVIY